jgi:Zn-dependent M28 family amino/carboxypeptidase
LWVAHPQKPDRLALTVHPEYTNQVLFNVIGVLPGKSKPGEAIIFSAHYDHLGTADRKRGDVIFNGANDNASGTTALLALARYYAEKNNNERTLIFCAFAGEELGLLGSKAFIKNLAPDSIKAVINLEMLGRAQYGKNKVFITGATYSDFDKLFRQNIKGTGVKVVMEPKEEKELFKRSDNYPFAKEGIPAHTIMSSDDDDACYHRECDEVGRIEFTHMAAVINAIVQGCAPIISGEQTPSRINKKRL